MKDKLLRIFVFLLSISLLVGLVPATSLAADNELVLTSIGNSNATTTDGLENATDRAVTLTVPFSFSGALNVETGLTYSKADSIGTISFSFSDSTADVGDTVTMTVSYNKGSDTTLLTTKYSITVARASKIDAVFKGSIAKSATAVPTASEKDIEFTSADFSGPKMYTANDGGAMSAVSITGSGLGQGALKQYIGGLYTEYTEGTKISVSDLQNLVFDGLASGSVNYVVTAYDAFGNAVGTGFLAVTFTAITLPTLTAAVSASVFKGSSYTFKTSDFTNCTNLNNGKLQSIQITPSASGYGTWSGPSGDFTSTTTVNAADITSGKLTFKGVSAGIASFTWTAANEAGSSSTTGSGSVVVSDIPATVPYSTSANTTITLKASDFYSACSNKTGYGLNYIYFTSLPSYSNGTLYYNSSSAVTANTPYYYSSSSPLLSYVSFTPYSGFTGTVTIPFTGVSTVNTTFSGTITITVAGSATISYSTAANTAVTLNASDFYSACSSKTGYGLNYIYFTSLPSYSNGTLYYNSSSAVTANTPYYYSSSSPLLSYVSFTPYSGFTGTVTIPFTGVSTVNTTFSGTITITVAGSATISYSTAANTAVTLNASDFYSACSSKTGYGLNYIYFTSLPSYSNGTLYYNSSSAVTANTPYYYSSSSPLLSYVSFTPYSGFTGTVTIPFTGVSTVNTTFSGTITITVGGSATISYSTAVNTPKTFATTDFNTACSSITGGTLSYLYFSQLSTSYGALYYGYSSASNPGTAISSSNQIAASYLSAITFVPASNYTGTVTLTYTGVNTSGTSYTGYVKITVGGSADVTYTTAVNTPKTFATTDFNTACSSITGGTLSYLYFSQLSTSYGALYYGYSSASNPGTAISSSNQIAASYLSAITFVPASNYTGTVTITYTGVNTSGTSYTGYVKITVGGSADVTYTTAVNTPKTFSTTDFHTASSSITGGTLSYLYFSQPSTSYGKLYYSYSSASNPGTAINSSNQIAAAYLSSITFVPASNYTGTVTLPYTGYSTNGVQYQGSVVIKVNKPASDISYTIKNNQTTKLVSTDVNTVCYNATGSNLNYVVFTLPAAINGKLYYNYTSASNTGSAVSAGTAYYNGSSPYLSYVTFVPAANYAGSVTITYTGYNINGASYTGKIIIQVNKATGSSHFTDVGSSYDWAAGAIDYLFDAGVVKGTGTNLFSPGANITRGDFMLMLCKAMEFSASTKSNFSDVPKNSYYYDAIATAKALGLAKGYDNKFNPSSPLSRQDAMVFIDRALAIAGVTLTPGSNSDISGFTDKGNIASYALTAVKTLVKAGIIKGNNNKLNPTGILSRAEMAVILHKVMVTY